MQAEVVDRLEETRPYIKDVYTENVFVLPVNLGIFIRIILTFYIFYLRNIS